VAFDVSQISGSFSAAASDIFAGMADASKAQAAEAQAGQAMTASQADLLKSQGDLAEGTAYGQAATLAEQNAAYTAQSTAIQQSQADRALFQSLGGQRAGVAASGFGEGGSAGDILRSSASQGALNRAVLGQQGLITEAGYTEQAASYTALQTVAGLASQSDILAAKGEVQAAQGYEAQASADRTAATGSDISAIISGIAGVAGIFMGIPPAGGSLGSGGMGLPGGAATGGLY
jgi:hypothetical protein